MSNFMHKVKDAVSSHLHSMNKGSHHDSSKMENPVNDPSEASKMGDKMEDPGITTGAATTGTTSYDPTARDPNMGDTMKTGDNYGSTTAGMGGSGGYGSGDINTGSRLNESMMANEMNPPVNTSLGDRETYGGNMASTTAPMSQTGNTMKSGANTYNADSSNMANQMENRAQEEMGNLSGQQGFTGAAAGGSSYNAPKPTSKRRSSGPHSSNLLNKLDPRVHSSDYENNTTSNQRGN